MENFCNDSYLRVFQKKSTAIKNGKVTDFYGVKGFLGRVSNLSESDPLVQGLGLMWLILLKLAIAVWRASGHWS
jgi:hypothetical protein